MVLNGPAIEQLSQAVMHGKDFHFAIRKVKLLLQLNDALTTGNTCNQFHFIEWFGQIFVGARLQTHHYFRFIIQGC